MTTITLHVELPPDADQDVTAAEIKARLAALDEIDQVVASPESTRFVAETIASIAVVVSIIKGTKDVAEALHDAIPKIKLVLKDLGLTNVKVEVAEDQVPIDKVGRSHTQKMAS
jgi:hypothetical protein